MRQLMLEEIMEISGGEGKPLLAMSAYEFVPWAAGAYGATFGYAAGSGIYSASVAGVNIGSFAVGGLAAAVVGTICFAAGKLFADEVLYRIAG